MSAGRNSGTLADPELVLAAWRGGIPQLWPEIPAGPDSDDPWHVLLRSAGRDPAWAQVLQSLICDP